MKLMNDAQYNELKTKASAYDATIRQIGEANPGLKEADIAQADLQALLAESVPSNALETANATIATLQAEIASLKTELNVSAATITELKGIPADVAASLYHDGDGPAVDEDIAIFADKHEGDDIAIVNELKRRGIV